MKWAVYTIIVLSSSFWVLIDARNIQINKNNSKDMGPQGWFAYCLVLWIIGFPAYLLTRKVRMKARETKIFR